VIRKRKNEITDLKTVFDLTLPAEPNESWTETNLHSLVGLDGNDPAYAGVVLGPKQVLCGTMAHGGTANAGVVYSLPPPTQVG
jgi:hypothetical protein